MYCLLYAAAGALIGMAPTCWVAQARRPRSMRSPRSWRPALHPAAGGLVLAAALAAVMSTSSGALIATATVFSQDIVARPIARRRVPAPHDHVAQQPAPHAAGSASMVIIACVCCRRGNALTVAYDIPVCGLPGAKRSSVVCVRRGTNIGAASPRWRSAPSRILVTMISRATFANEPIYVGLLSGLIIYAGSRAWRASPPRPKSRSSDRRSRGEADEPVPPRHSAALLHRAPVLPGPCPANIKISGCQNGSLSTSAVLRHR